MTHMNVAKPFLKWAGGKTQLLSQIAKNLPEELTRQSFTYVEPFVGSGAVLFWMLQHYPNIEKVIINDVNAELINTYQIIATQPQALIEILAELEQQFHALEGLDAAKAEFFYAQREAFNSQQHAGLAQAARFIFLNRTCFNGLYRVNRKGQYNVPIGRYNKPTICDADNLRAVSQQLQKVELLCGDFEQTLAPITGTAFFYFDPPYKPLHQTSSFNAYASNAFDDAQQIRLRDFCIRLNEQGIPWMLSNSDPCTIDVNNRFFDELYQQFQIQRVIAKRMINSKANKRGALTELLITNYAMKP